VKMVKAPWTPEQAEHLVDFQRSHLVHPFTCPNGHGALNVRHSGLACRLCSYTQDWVHQDMLDGSALIMRAESHRRLFGEQR
jgi:hypothetical protein